MLATSAIKVITSRQKKEKCPHLKEKPSNMSESRTANRKNTLTLKISRKIQLRPRIYCKKTNKKRKFSTRKDIKKSTYRKKNLRHTHKTQTLRTIPFSTTLIHYKTIEIITKTILQDPRVFKR